MHRKWTRGDSKGTRGGLHLQYNSSAEGTQVDPRGLEGDSVLNPFTIQFIPEGTRPPFSIYNNIGGGAVSPPGHHHNIVLGPRCPKRGWSKNLFKQFGSQRPRKQQYSGDWPVTGIISLRFGGSGGFSLARAVAKNFLCGPKGATLLFNLTGFGVVESHKLMQQFLTMAATTSLQDTQNS